MYALVERFDESKLCFAVILNATRRHLVGCIHLIRRILHYCNEHRLEQFENLLFINTVVHPSNIRTKCEEK